MSASAAGDARAAAIRAILDDLIAQRRRMRETTAGRGLLEANRLGIVYWQRQLSLCEAGGPRAAVKTRARAPRAA